MKFSRAISTLCVSGVLCSTAHGGPPPEEHFDIWLRPVDGRIVTGSISEGTPGTPIEEEVRVFGAELGEDVQFPFSTSEPGIQALAGDETAGMVYTFSITDALGAWNGNGFDDAVETMLIEFGPASVTTGAGFVDGFSFNGLPDGLLHDHFDFTLQGGSPLAGTDPQPGVYLLGLTMRGVNGNVVYEPSLPFWIVFNLGQDETTHDAASDWVENNLVPAPGGLILLTLAFGAQSGRRRR